MSFKECSVHEMQHNKALIYLRVREWTQYVTRMGAAINTYRILVVKHNGNMRLGRSELKWQDNFEMHL